MLTILVMKVPSWGLREEENILHHLTPQEAH